MRQARSSTPALARLQAFVAFAAMVLAAVAPRIVCLEGVTAGAVALHHEAHDDEHRHGGSDHDAATMCEADDHMHVVDSSMSAQLASSARVDAAPLLSVIPWIPTDASQTAVRISSDARSRDPDLATARSFASLLRPSIILIA